MFTGFYYIKVMYLGANFHGLVRQPDLRTVEGELIQGLQKTGYIPKTQYKKLPLVFYAGRTDKGVNAMGMVFSFLNIRPNFYPIELNNILPDDIFVWSFAKVHDETEIQKLLNDSVENQPKNEVENLPAKNREQNGGYGVSKFTRSIKNPRFYATLRHYKYLIYDPMGGIKVNKLQRIMKKFEGRHDFVNFSKKDGDKNTKRSISSIEIVRSGNLVVVDLKAQSFLWNQIRKIVSSSMKVHNKDWPEKYIDRLLNPEDRELVSLVKLAPPNNLILWNVEYPEEIEFNTDTNLKKILNKKLAEMVQNMMIQSEILQFIKNNL